MSSTTAAPALSRRRPVPATRLAMLLAALPAWWHLLSLDAPTVAALWSWSLARALGVHPPLTAPLLLATGTWLLYVADRLLDGLRDTAILRDRHHFSRRHRPAFLAAAIPAGALLLWLIAFHMSPAARRDDTALFALTLTYFTAVHVPGAAIRRRLPKELAVALIFALATAVPAWVRIPHTMQSVTLLAAATILFAGLCWLNCAAIETWESDRAMQSTTALHGTTLWLQRHLAPVSITLAAGGLIAAAFCALQREPRSAALFLAQALAAALLAMLHRRHHHLPVLPLRIAADAVLLTPLLILPMLR
ncbi:hypothetical protein [Silvibacterium dinghuense]|uniref:Prenyltransferase n=1 Tax=Silvibacterium dinghuense TaxID=1560006 RepID=A0A4Q1SH76_9BACT|nr:hypothetical protein [Silvibacterium dinghuense]RXS96921.1 hypothetical protein ESZ00_02990 [Silvibacterium dinghuense]GGG94700.1 hypothetical protein GCM10011586_07040 [Silvibacterium dinghuense]